MQQETSHISRTGFSAFFIRLPKQTTVVDQVVVHRLPRASTKWWNIHSCVLNTVNEHMDELLKCFQTIGDSGNFDPLTVREAECFVKMLQNKAFCFFLALFHNIVSKVDMLFNQLQKSSLKQLSRGSQTAF